MTKMFRTILLAAVFIMCLSGTAKALSAPKDVWVTVDGKTTTYVTLEENVGNFLKSENIVLEKNDTIDAPLDEKFLDNYVTKINISKSINVKVVIDENAEVVNLTSGTKVGTLVLQLEKKYNSKYAADIKRSDVLTNNMVVNLQSVSNHSYATTEFIQYDIEIVNDDTIPEGEFKVFREGKDGKKETITNIDTKQGQTVSEEVLSEKIIEQPVNKIIKRGTMKPKKVAFEDSPLVVKTYANGEFQYVAEYTMNASAYTAGPESTGKRPGDPGYGITASGMKVQKGVVAVDKSVIPLGTKLYIEGYGYAIAADTGGGINGHEIDLFYENLGDALAFGRRNVKVYVLAS